MLAPELARATPMLRIRATCDDVGLRTLGEHDVGGLGDDVLVVGPDGGGVAAVDLRRLL